MSIRTLRIVSVVLTVAGVVTTAILSGVWTIPLTCSPFLLFAGATLLGRYYLSVICTIVALLLAGVYGIRSYHAAFWIHHHGEADAMAVVVVPVLQALVGLFVFIVAFSEWLVYRYRHRESMLPNASQGQTPDTRLAASGSK